MSQGHIHATVHSLNQVKDR